MLLAFISCGLVLLLELLNVLGGNRKLYTGSLESWSGLPGSPIPIGASVEYFGFLINSKMLALIDLKFKRVVGHCLG